MILKMLRKSIFLVFILPILANAQPEIGVIISKTEYSGIDFVALVVRDDVSKKITFLRSIMPEDVGKYNNSDKQLMSDFNSFHGVGKRLVTEADHIIYDLSQFESLKKLSDFTTKDSFDKSLLAIENKYRALEHSFRRWEYDGYYYAREALKEANITITGKLNSYRVTVPMQLTSLVKNNKKYCCSRVREYRPYFPSTEHLKKAALVTGALTVAVAAWYY